MQLMPRRLLGSVHAYDNAKPPIIDVDYLFQHGLLTDIKSKKLYDSLIGLAWSTFTPAYWILPRSHQETISRPKKARTISTIVRLMGQSVPPLLGGRQPMTIYRRLQASEHLHNSRLLLAIYHLEPATGGERQSLFCYWAPQGILLWYIRKTFRRSWYHSTPSSLPGRQWVFAMHTSRCNISLSI